MQKQTRTYWGPIGKSAMGTLYRNVSRGERSNQNSYSIIEMTKTEMEAANRGVL